MLTTTAPYTAGETTITTDGGVAIGADGMRRRLRALLPASWFDDDAPILDGLLAGIAAVLAVAARFILYARAQTRVATSTGGFLDLTALDFFGLRIGRRRGEADRPFSLRLRREMFRPRVTRSAIASAVEDLTGHAPDIFEPWHPGDCGAYGVGTTAYAGGTTERARIAGYGTPLGGYGLGGAAYVIPDPGEPGSPGAGCYGSLELPNQIFVRVHRGANAVPDAAGAAAYGFSGAYGGGVDADPALSGYGGARGGYGVGEAAYVIPRGPTRAFPGAGFYVAEASDASVTDAEIHARIADTVAAGVIAWTTIEPAQRA